MKSKQNKTSKFDFFLRFDNSFDNSFGHDNSFHNSFDNHGEIECRYFPAGRGKANSDACCQGSAT